MGVKRTQLLTLTDRVRMWEKRLQMLSIHISVTCEFLEISRITHLACGEGTREMRVDRVARAPLALQMEYGDAFPASPAVVCVCCVACALRDKIYTL